MSPSRRKIGDQHEAEALLTELVRSGQDLVSFCRARGLDGRSLGCWRTNLRRRRPAPAPGFAHPATLRLFEVAAAPSRPPSAASYRIRVGDIVVEVGDDFQDDTLRRLIAVAGCPVNQARRPCGGPQRKTLRCPNRHAAMSARCFSSICL